jgi:hypothetical protein
MNDIDYNQYCNSHSYNLENCLSNKSLSLSSSSSSLGLFHSRIRDYVEKNTRSKRISKTLKKSQFPTWDEYCTYGYLAIADGWIRCNQIDNAINVIKFMKQQNIIPSEKSLIAFLRAISNGKTEKHIDQQNTDNNNFIIFSNLFNTLGFIINPLASSK